TIDPKNPPEFISPTEKQANKIFTDMAVAFKFPDSIYDLQGKVFAAANDDKLILELATTSPIGIPVVYSIKFTNSEAYQSILNSLNSSPTMLAHFIHLRALNNYNLQGKYKNMNIISPAEMDNNLIQLGN